MTISASLRTLITTVAVVLMAACAGSDSAREPATQSTDTTGSESSPATPLPGISETPRDSTTSSPASNEQRPPIDESLADRLPSVDGYRNATDLDIRWSYYRLPSDINAYSATVDSVDGQVGIVIVAQSTTTSRLIDEYVNTLFEEPFQLVTSTQTVEQGEFVVTNGAHATWRAIHDVPVVAATLPADDHGIWAWTHDDLLWIVRGHLAAEDYVNQLVSRQQAESPSAPYDYLGLQGELIDRFPAIPGYTYVDLPRSTVLEALPNAIAGDCLDQFYIGYVNPADDSNPELMAEGDLVLDMSSIGNECRDGGFLDDFNTDLAGNPQFTETVIAGAPVHRTDNEIVLVTDRIIVHLSSSDPATFATMQPFIVPFIDGHLNAAPRNETVAAPPLTTAPQPQQILIDLNSLLVGQCLLGPELAEGDTGGGLIEVIDCALPHHAEVFHVSDLPDPAGTPYPGDRNLSDRTITLCTPGFEDFVGRPWTESRLGYIYIYPFDETSWNDNDRRLICYVHDGLGQTLTGSMAGTDQ